MFHSVFLIISPLNIVDEVVINIVYVWRAYIIICV